MADARRGCQTPAYQWCASWARTEGRMATELARAYGTPPHPWQSLVLDDWLAIGDDGRLLNSLCLLPVPRQNGKTGVCDPRETWGLVRRHEWILHTAQEYQTAKKAFDRLRWKFGERRNDPMARFPELNRLVGKYTTSANQMILELTDGGMIEFRTRGSGGGMGRGGTYDLIVVDEAQEYTDEQDASLSPLNSAAPHGSPQTILMGTVPDPKRPAAGETFARLRRAAHESPSDGMCIHEWGVDAIPADVRDEEAWYRANPSLGYQLLVSALRKDSKSMSRERFAMEHLGWWPEAAGKPKPPVSAADWAACAADEAPDDGVVVYAVKFSPDGATGALCAAVRPDGGPVFVEGIRHFAASEGLSWLTDWLSCRTDACAEMVIDGQSNAQALHDRLRDAGVPDWMIVRPKTADAIAAFSSFAAAVKEHSVAHSAQPSLTESATRCPKRRIGTGGGWGFESTDEADASLVEAAAFAFRQASITTKDQRRELRCG